MRRARKGAPNPPAAVAELLGRVLDQARDAEAKVCSCRTIAGKDRCARHPEAACDPVLALREIAAAIRPIGEATARAIDDAVVRGVVLALSTLPPPVDARAVAEVLRAAAIDGRTMRAAQCAPADIERMEAALAATARKAVPS